MSTLIIGNQLTEELTEGENALPVDYVQFLGAISHRMAWCAKRGDVIVLPNAPEPAFLDHVWRHLGIAGDPPQVVVPAPGPRGDDLLYVDRLTDPALLARLRALIGERGITDLLPFYVDETVVWLATELGLDKTVTAFDFLRIGGAELVNSKTFFRTIALGNGVPIPPGTIVDGPGQAEDYIWPLLSSGTAVILKQDVHGGGFGNEVLSPVPADEARGVAHVVHVPGRAELAEHLAKRWDWYSSGRGRRVVVEHFLVDAVPVYAEVVIRDEGVRLFGFGEMRMKPTNNGLVVPPPSADLPEFGRFLGHAVRIGEVLRAIGYRGHTSIDGIVLPDGAVLVNEFNGRIGGSTHIHLIGERVLGADYLDKRVLVARSRCGWPATADALDVIDSAGLAYDRERGTGAIISGDDGQCLFVGETTAGALELEQRFVEALAAGPRA
jgi:hypothetical protein